MKNQDAKKPREFWIYDVIFEDHGKIPVAFKHHKNIKNSIHVIEMSAYKELEEKLTEARELVLECFTQACEEREKYDHMYISTYERAQDNLIEWGLIKENQCQRK